MTYRGAHRRFHAAVGLCAAILAGSFVFATGPASSDPGNLPAPLGQATNTGTGSLGCPNNASWKGFDNNGNPDNFGPVAVKIEDGGRVWVSDFRNSEQGSSTAGRVYSWPSVAAAQDCTTPDRELDGLNQPEGIEVDSSGNLFVADTGNSRILKFTKAKTDTFTTVGNGAATPAGNFALEISTKNGNADSFVRGLAIGNNRLWAADDNRNRVVAFDVLGANNNTTPDVVITDAVCHPKAVTFVGGKLFVANFPQGGCIGSIKRYDTLANNAAPAATFTIQNDHPIDLSGFGTTLVASSTDGGIAKFAGAPTSGSASAPLITSVGQKGKTGTYDLKAPTFGLDTISSDGNPTLIADSGNFRVVQADLTATTTAVTSSKNPSTVGDNVAFTATVTPASGGAKPTGTVQFKADGANLGPAVPLDANGTATTSTASLAKGTHTITAVYSGDANFNPSTGTLQQEVQGKGTSTSVTASKATPAAGDRVTFTATVAPASGTVTPTGTVQFNDNGTDLGGPVALTNGSATSPETTITQGAHTITATYSGDANFAASSGTLSFNAGAPTLAVDPSTVVAGRQTTLSGTRWGADETLQITLQSTPVSLGMVRTDSAGRFSTLVTIPAGFDPGPHQIIVTSNTQRATIGITVVAATTVTTRPTTGTLRVTGGPISTLTLAGTLTLALGFALLTAGRRRRYVVCQPATVIMQRLARHL
ncbi:MAG: Ig-like domain repeat protein [Actinobacteria bacterium]|nr:Ig-like domain repeat protein [Actinomycetota bacterium]